MQQNQDTPTSRITANIVDKSTSSKNLLSKIFGRKTNPDEKPTEKVGVEIEHKPRSYEMVEDTPFAIMENDMGFHICIGMYQIWEPLKTSAECKKLIHEKQWNFIINVISAIIKISDIHKTGGKI